jgi:hypothetical protein
MPAQQTMASDPMTIRIAILVTTAILVAAFTPRLAAAQNDIVGFKMPSGNVHCMLEAPEQDNGLRCDIRQTASAPPPKPASCQFGWGKAFEILPRGTAGTRICVSDSVYDPSLPPLAYGTPWNKGGFVCKSAETGLTCTNAAGHGFTLSKDVQKLF